MAHGDPAEKSIGSSLLLREITKAITHLSPDRSLQFLVESAVSITNSKWAVLLTPHEKLREMVPLIEHLPFDREKYPFPNEFYGACYKIFLEGQSLDFNEQEADVAHLTIKDHSGCSLAMPIQLAGKLVALLFLCCNRKSGGLTDDQKGFLEILSPILGSLIENFRLHTEMIHKNSRLSALYEISQRTESLIDLRDVYEAMGKVVRNFIECDSYMLYLLGPDGETLETRSGSAEGPFPPKIQIGQGPVGAAARDKKPHLTYTEAFKSVLILPMIVSGKLIGVVVVGSRKSYAYKDEDIIGLRIITTQIASIDELFKELLRLKGFTQHILESMTAGVLILDNNGLANFSNQALTKIISQPIPEGWSPFSNDGLFPAPLRQILVKVLESKVAIEKERIRLETLPSPRVLEVDAFPFRDEVGIMLGFAFFFRDITQIIQLEDQVKRADRLSALGVLAAGIAHEIRNPLTGMKMIVQLLAADVPPDDSKKEPLGIIQNEIDRLEKIISSLLDFARPTKPQAVPISLPEILNACLFLIQNQINKSGARVEKDIPSDLPQMVGDASQLKQVFLNIITNAVQSLKTGGTIKLKVEVIPGWVVVAIADTGIGISRERLKAIFDPFMTTKEDGTGLGLSVALRIVEEHGGRINVDSIENQGSTFSVMLPSESADKSASAAN